MSKVDADPPRPARGTRHGAVSLAEGLVFAEALGLEPESFLALLKMSAAYSVAMDTKGRKMLDGDFAAQSRIAQHHKDVSIVLDYAVRLGQDLPLTRAHLDVLRRAIEAGDGELDNAAVIREIRRRGPADQSSRRNWKMRSE